MFLYHILFTYSSTNEHLGHFHLLAIDVIAFMNMGIQITLQNLVFNFFEYIPRRRIAESYGNSIFAFLRSWHTVFYSGCTTLYSHQQCTSVPISPHPCRHLLLFEVLFVLIIAILLGMQWCLTVVLICISLMISDIEHLSMCILAICYILWKNVYSRPLPIFKLSCLFYVVEL